MNSSCISALATDHQTDASTSKKRVFLNHDDTHFAHSRTKAGIDPDEEHVRDFVRQYKGTDVTDLLFCIGGRIADVPNSVKESWCDKFHQTRENGHDVCYTNHYTRLYRDLNEVQKIDIYALWIEEAGKAGIRPWLSFRLNDCHDNGAETSILFPTFLHEHPEYQRVRYREAIGYFDRCLDFSFEPVRKRELAYIADILSRYDPDGVDIDWMREIFCFAPGREDAEVMTGFMRDVRKLANEAAQHRGHPVNVLARVPSDPTVALRYGFDVAQWADEGLVDVVAPSPRWSTTDNNLPADAWKRLLRGTEVLLAPGLETRAICQAGRGAMTTTGQVVGMAAAFYGSGADGIYLYNYFDDPAWQDPEKRYWKALGGHPHIPFQQPQETLAVAWPNQMTWLRLVGDAQKVFASPRQHLLTWRDISPLGEDWPTPFPTKVEKYYFREFRLATGPVTGGQSVFVRLGVPDGKPPRRVFVNGRPCVYVCNETCAPALTGSPLCVYEVKDYGETTAIVEVVADEDDITLDYLDLDIR